jgi:hypothetical protein
VVFGGIASVDGTAERGARLESLARGGIFS